MTQLNAACFDEISPCPFCGGKADVMIGLHSFHDATVECRDCGAQSRMFDCQQDTVEYIDDASNINRVQAISAWNTRRATESQA